jgi:hypothetical protein
MTGHDRRTVRHSRRLVSIATLALLSATVLGVSPVAAAAPSNDDIGSPRVVGSLPYSDGPYDTTEATTGATDPTLCTDAPGNPDRSTVWYSFTPSTTGSYLADTFDSDYDTTLYVGTANGSGGIDVINCNDDSKGLQSAVVWAATSGTTYLIAVGTCCGGGTVGAAGGGGSLVFHVSAAPPSPTISLTVASTGKFTPYGVATIHGTVACPNGDGADVFVDLSQRVGRLTIRGFGEMFVEDCSAGPVPWQVEINSEDGKFLGGRTTALVFGTTCGAVECADTSISATVALRH